MFRNKVEEWVNDDKKSNYFSRVRGSYAHIVLQAFADWLDGNAQLRTDAESGTCPACAGRGYWAGVTKLHNVCLKCGGSGQV